MFNFNNYQNQILNLTQSVSFKPADRHIIKFMTNKTAELNRNSHCCAQLLVKTGYNSQDYSDKSKTFTHWNIHYYYFTSSSWFDYNDNQTTKLSLREDLIINWAKSNHTDKTFVIMFTDSGKYYAKWTVKELLEQYIEGNYEKRLNELNKVVVLFKINALHKSNDSEYTGDYNTKYWHPEYIGKTRYLTKGTKYSTKPFVAYACVNGERNGNSRIYTSARSAYESLKKIGYSKSLQWLRKEIKSGVIRLNEEQSLEIKLLDSVNDISSEPLGEVPGIPAAPADGFHFCNYIHPNHDIIYNHGVHDIITEMETVPASCHGIPSIPEGKHIQFNPTQMRSERQSLYKLYGITNQQLSINLPF